MSVTTTVVARRFPYRDPARPLVKAFWFAKGRVTGDVSAGDAQIVLRVGRLGIDRADVQDGQAIRNDAVADTVRYEFRNWEDVFITAVQNYTEKTVTLIQGAGGEYVSPADQTVPLFSLPVRNNTGQDLDFGVVFRTNTNLVTYEAVGWGYIYDGDIIQALTATPTAVPA